MGLKRWVKIRLDKFYSFLILRAYEIYKDCYQRQKNMSFGNVLVNAVTTSNGFEAIQFGIENLDILQS